MANRRILIILGTRPEAIKLAPVILRLQKESQARVKVCLTGQHREMAIEALSHFGIQDYENLDIMQPGQSLSYSLGSCLLSLDRVIQEFHPDWVLVQGDTNSALAGGIAAFHHRVRVGHVEAGLRTNDKFSPHPEEMNRVLLSKVSDFHFAPTEMAHKNLLLEGIPPHSISTTGNTVVDAVNWIQARYNEDTRENQIVVTLHRRENFGQTLESILKTLREFFEGRDYRVTLPVHPNPQVSNVVRSILGEHPAFELVAPMDYPSMIRNLASSKFVITDSGGIQEEAVCLNVPVVVLRDTTERMEGVEAGRALLAGTQACNIFEALEQVENEEFQLASNSLNPYGDGRAADRIVDILFEDTEQDREIEASAGHRAGN